MPQRREHPRQREATSPPSTGFSSAPRTRRSRRLWPGPAGRHRLFLGLIAAVGAILGVGLVGIVWRDTGRADARREQPSGTDLADKPQRAVTVMVIGTDADRIAGKSNGAAAEGPGNADALMLVRVNPEGPLQVLNLPAELAVMLPGQSQPRRLGDLYRLGGAGLTADVLRELLGLQTPAPDRFVVLPRQALRKIVDDLGGLEVNPPRTMAYEDKTQKLQIDLQSGLQRLDGQQVEHMARFRDAWLGDSGRRNNQQLLIESLRQRMGQTEQLARIPDLLAAWQDKVDTNLSPREALSLMLVGLDETHPLQFDTLPLDPIKESHGGMRQLNQDAPASLWKAP